MPILETLGGFRIAPTAVLGAVTMNAGDSNVVRACNAPGFGKLLNIWGLNQLVGNIRLRSPNFNDLQNGINVINVAAQVYPLMPEGQNQVLTSQDPLIIENSGSVTAGQYELVNLLMYYLFPGDQPKARLIDERTLDTYGYGPGNITTVQQAIVGGATGNWTGAQALNLAATGVTLKPNTDYAWLGSMTDLRVASISLRGPDTSNFRVGLPGESANKDQNRDFWLLMTRLHGLPLIPVFNTAGLGQIFCEIFCNQAAGTANVTHFFQQLAPGAVQ